jgi:ribosome-binding protein aMBF1 (putative translation factor)
MTKTSIGRIYVSRTVLKVLKKYIAEDQRKVDKREQLLNRLKDVVEMRGITPKELASKIGKRPSEIKKLLKGEVDFSAEILGKVESELAIRLTEV